MISRKTFLRQMAGLAAWPLVPGAIKAMLPGQPAAAAGIDVPPPEAWLADWQIAVRTPIVDSADDLERVLLRAMGRNEVVEFVYDSGSAPGAARRVRPVLLYQVAGYTGRYCTGYCETRREIRTFRLDRARRPRIAGDAGAVA